MEENNFVSWMGTAVLTMAMHKPIRTAVSKCIKATAGAALALVKAHPVGAAVTVTVIVVVGATAYCIKNSKNDEKEGDQKYSSVGSTRQKETTNTYFYDPVTKSVTDSAATKVAENDIRKRQVTKRTSSTTEKNLSEASSSNEGKVLVSDLNNGMSAEEKVQSVENSNHLSANLVFLNLDGFFEDDIDIGSESSVSSDLSGKSDRCRTCKNLANTRFMPCNHRYVCHDCAGIILKLHKKCKICRREVKSYCVELSPNR